MNTQKKFEEALGISSVKEASVLEKNTRLFRFVIGVLGLSLPWLLIIFSSDCNNPMESISHYYYTRSGTLFSVILSLIAFFLIIYPKDFVSSSLAGFCALCVVFLPTSQLDASCSCNIVYINHSSFRVSVHYISAAIFLIILTSMCFFSFTKPDEEQKNILRINIVKNKWLYITCGLVMSFSLIIMGLRALADISFFSEKLKLYADFYDFRKLTFYMETVALTAFGIAWLTKGRDSVKATDFRTNVNNNFS